MPESKFYNNAWLTGLSPEEQKRVKENLAAIRASAADALVLKGDFEPLRGYVRPRDRAVMNWVYEKDIPAGAAVVLGNDGKVRAAQDYMNLLDGGKAAPLADVQRGAEDEVQRLRKEVEALKAKLAAIKAPPVPPVTVRRFAKGESV